MFGIGADGLLAMANEKLGEIGPLRAKQPEIAQVFAIEALTLATMATAQATLEVADRVGG